MPLNLLRKRLTCAYQHKLILKLVLLSFLVVTAGCDSKLDSLIHPIAKVTKTLTPEENFLDKLKLAETGDAKAQTEVGVAYLDGKGVPRDLSKALSWLEKSAQQNNDDAQLTLGLYYLGVYNNKDEFYDAGIDEKKGLALLLKAAEQGNKVAQYKMGDMYRYRIKFTKSGNISKNREQAIEWYQKSADQGYADAQASLGTLYLGYTPGFKKDYAKGAGYLQKAALQGHIEAQNDLAFAYRSGQGVPIDDVKAADLFLKSAISDNVEGQEESAHNYLRGEGVTQDYVLAYAWANIASAKDEAWSHIAIKERDWASQQLSPQGIAEAQRISSKWRKGEPLVREKGQSNKAEIATNNLGDLKKVSTGTIFVINKNGEAITNHHVIQGCAEVRIAGREGEAKVVTSDSSNDLALVHIPGVIDAVATINSEPTKLRQGDDVFVFGYPLSSALSSGGNITPGVVSAITGLGNNTNHIQITAPIQPGSSGSPVLNKKGSVVGVVASKLSEIKVAKAIGEISQTVNFAVNGQTLISFLEAHQVKYSTEGFTLFSKSTADLADDARKWTMLAECWK